MRLFKGSARPVARRSPNALYDPALAGFGESGGLFSQQASPGFIELWSLQSRMAYNVRKRETGEGMRNRGYTMLGVVTWEGIKLVLRRKLGQNRIKIGAAAAVLLVLIGGLAIAKATTERRATNSRVAGAPGRGWGEGGARSPI